MLGQRCLERGPLLLVDAAAASHLIRAVEAGKRRNGGQPGQVVVVVAARDCGDDRLSGPARYPRPAGRPVRRAWRTFSARATLGRARTYSAMHQLLIRNQRQNSCSLRRRRRARCSGTAVDEAPTTSGRRRRHRWGCSGYRPRSVSSAGRSARRSPRDRTPRRDSGASLTTGASCLAASVR